MSLIAEIEQADATGTVAEVYQQAEEIMGYVPNALKIHSVNPPMLAQQFNYIGSIMQHASLSGKLFAAIRMMISVDQQCEYCIDLNVGMLINMYGMTADEVASLKSNPKNSNLEAKEKALLLYTVKATKDAGSVGETDMQQLRGLGCTDLEIYDALRHGASQVMMDIMLNAFKVKKE